MARKAKSDSLVQEISQDLHNTVKKGEHIEEVYFTAEGNHYFNRFELVERVEVKRGGTVSWGDKKTGKYYGSLLTEIREETTVMKNASTSTRSFVATVANPDALIAETLTRDEVLALPTFKIDYKAIQAEPELIKESRRAKMSETKRELVAE